PRPQRPRHPDQFALGLDGVDDGLGYLVWRHGKWRLIETRRHLGLDEAWSHDEHVYAVVTERLAKTEKETVEASLGRAVDEVGAPYALTRDAGQRHDPAVCLGLHALAEQHAKVDRCRVVDLG